MNTKISRTQFLRGDFSGQRTPIRPPWSLPETEFLEACTQCGECIKACPQDILTLGAGCYPQVSFLQGECAFCGECADHCNANAFLKHEQPPKPRTWSIRAFVGEHCLVLKKVFCQVCSDHCEQNAINFRFRVNSLSYPDINGDNCTGCGACYAPCPTNAITLRSS